MTDGQSLRAIAAGYRVLGRLRRGPDSAVYHAVREEDGSEVALKVLLSEAYPIDDEAANLRRLPRHPNLVRVVGSGRTVHGFPFFATEYHREGSYADHLARSGPVPVEDAIQVGRAIAEALHAVHGVGLLHRDVTPANILRGAGGPLLTDFGIAALPEELSGTVALDRLTPHHAAPEALLRQDQDARSDVYGLASTVWTLLAGHPPFAAPDQPSPDPFEYRESALRRPVPPVPREDVPPWLNEVLRRGMAKAPADRYPDAAAFAMALRDRRAPDETPSTSEAAPVIQVPAPGSAPTGHTMPAPPGPVEVSGRGSAAVREVSPTARPAAGGSAGPVAGATAGGAGSAGRGPGAAGRDVGSAAGSTGPAVGGSVAGGSIAGGSVAGGRSGRAGAGAGDGVSADVDSAGAAEAAAAKAGSAGRAAGSAGSAAGSVAGAAGGQAGGAGGNVGRAGPTAGAAGGGMAPGGRQAASSGRGSAAGGEEGGSAGGVAGAGGAATGEPRSAASSGAENAPAADAGGPAAGAAAEKAGGRAGSAAGAAGRAGAAADSGSRSGEGAARGAGGGPGGGVAGGSSGGASPSLSQPARAARSEDAGGSAMGDDRPVGSGSAAGGRAGSAVSNSGGARAGGYAAPETARPRAEEPQALAAERPATVDEPTTAVAEAPAAAVEAPPAASVEPPPAATVTPASMVDAYYAAPPPNASAGHAWHRAEAQAQAPSGRVDVAPPVEQTAAVQAAASGYAAYQAEVEAVAPGYAVPDVGGLIFHDDLPEPDGALPPDRPRRVSKVLVGVAAAVIGLSAVLVGSLLYRVVVDDAPEEARIVAGAPENVRLADERFAVTLSWQDVSDGSAIVYVVGGPRGRTPSTMASAPRGATSVRVNGVNPEVDYCFRLVAAFSVDEVATSDESCTARFGPAPTPS